MTHEVICIFCAECKKGSREHVVPKSLGGNLVINYVCQDCNSVLGRVADSEFETNSYVAAAYKKIGWQDKLTDLMEKAEIRATDMNCLINMKLKIKGKNEFQITPQELEDGSLIVGEEDSVAVISKMIDRRKEEYLEKGLSEQEIEDNKEALLDAYDKADPNTELDYPQLGLRLIKHSSELEEKVQYSKKIPLRGISKIAYELLFFVAGHKCLDRRYEAYRKYSLGGERIPLIYQLFRSDREITFSPVHQLYLMEKGASLIAGIRLFRGYAWEADFGPNDLDVFGVYGKAFSCEKATGVGIELNLEDGTNRVLIRTDSEKWKVVGSIG